MNLHPSNRAGSNSPEGPGFRRSYFYHLRQMCLGEFWGLLIRINDGKCRVVCQQSLPLHPLPHPSLKQMSLMSHGLYATEHRSGILFTSTPDSWLCLTICNPMDCNPPGFSVHGILQSRTLEWVAISFSNISFYGPQIVTPFLTYELAGCSVMQLIFTVNMLLSM